MLLIGSIFASTNQKNYPDLGSDAPSVWNFCALFSDVISRRWRPEISGVFSGYNPFLVFLLDNVIALKYLLNKTGYCNFVYITCE